MSIRRRRLLELVRAHRLVFDTNLSACSGGSFIPSANCCLFYQAAHPILLALRSRYASRFVFVVHKTRLVSCSSIARIKSLIPVNGYECSF